MNIMDFTLLTCRRYRRLFAKGKNANLAIAAVARELAGFIWDIGRLAMSLSLEPHNTLMA
ncbi:hypothetical protein [Sodalis sp. RH23]|uniref:hypothetical protein n=1 Tax=unclassified Sodalis (in: enterobacteria) TaxID=2636512 RepID=UPI0039B58D07